MIVVPSIDIEGDRAVKRVKGERGSGIMLGDPFKLVDKIAGYGFSKIHIVDLDGAETGIQNSVVCRVASHASSLGLRVRVGGGIRSVGAAELLIECGARELVMGTLWIRDPREAKRVIDSVAAEFWASVDSREDVVFVKGWSERSSMTVDRSPRIIKGLGFRGVLYTDIAVEGTGMGVSRQSAWKARQVFSGLKLAYAGGIASMEDLELLDTLGFDEAVLGMAIYRGLISWKEVSRYA